MKLIRNTDDKKILIECGTGKTAKDLFRLFEIIASIETVEEKEKTD